MPNTSKPKTKKASKTVEEKIQELSNVKEPEIVVPPQVMQVVEVADEPEIVAEPVKEEVPEVEELVDAEDVLSEAKSRPAGQESKVSEFFSPSKETSSVGYPNISMHKKSIAPIIFWALGVCVLVVVIGLSIITISKGTFPISFARPTPTPTSAPTPIVTPTPSVNKKELEIEILNGSGIAGVASTLKTFLEEKGYTVAGTGNAKNYEYAKTEIQVKADKSAFLSVLQADLIGSYVIGTATATLKASLPYNAVIIIGKAVLFIKARSSGKPPLSEVVIPSASSIKISFPFLNKDCCSTDGLRTSSKDNLFLKSEAFNSKSSRLCSFARAKAIEVFPVPTGPFKITAFLFGNVFKKVLTS